MTVKAKLMLGLLLGFCALACLGTYHRTFISNALTFGHEQAGPQQSPSTHQELRGNRAKTKRPRFYFIFLEFKPRLEKQEHLGCGTVK